MKGMPTLRRPRDLDRVFDEGHWRRLRPVAIGIYHRGDEDQTRFAFVAGRRVGNAVRRNRARRRMREALRSMMTETGPGADVVLAARQDTAEVDFRVLQAAIRNALAGEGLLSEIGPEDAP